MLLTSETFSKDRIPLSTIILYIQKFGSFLNLLRKLLPNFFLAVAGRETNSFPNYIRNLVKGIPNLDRLE